MDSQLYLCCRICTTLIQNKLIPMP